MGIMARRRQAQERKIIGSVELPKHQPDAPEAKKVPDEVKPEPKTELKPEPNRNTIGKPKGR